ncbi:iron-siderophore ABC transporter ATP-binding protein [Bacillus sp. TS-2]|nr:iron-siderophore ABC transporter ATP-binding protein [Bacillus sp. TS-2]
MEMKELTFSYQKGLNIIEQFTSSIHSKKVTTIIGPNGSGKSTLLQLLSRNLKSKSGEVILNGKQIQSYSSKDFAKKLAMVHQHNEAPYDMTVEKLVSYGRTPYKQLLSSNEEADQEAINWAIQCTNLTTKRQSTLEELSGGERQRAWIAMSLAQKTPILFLDEPTTYLDLYHQLEILELVKQLNQKHGITIVMVLHDMNQAIRYSDHIMVMKQGKKVMEGTPSGVITREMIQEVYGVEAQVIVDQTYGLHVLPVALPSNI